MATAVIMPRQGQSVESCIITSWAKKVGDKVAKGDVLFSYETDKSAFDEVAEVEGTLLKILAAEGDDVPCLDIVCYIGAEGEDISALAGEKSDTPAPGAGRRSSPRHPRPTANGSKSRRVPKISRLKPMRTSAASRRQVPRAGSSNATSSARSTRALSRRPRTPKHTCAARRPL